MYLHFSSFCCVEHSISEWMDWIPKGKGATSPYLTTHGVD